jgi:hypothetical protein
MSAAIVQQFGGNPGYGYGTSQSASAGPGITIGNFLIACVSNTGRTDTPAVVDTLNPSNVFTEVIGGTNPTFSCSCSIWIAPIVAGGASTVKATWGGSNNSHLAVYEVSGISGTADQTDFKATTANPPVGNSKTTTSSGEFCVTIEVNNQAYSLNEVTPSGAWSWDYPGATGQQGSSGVATQIQFAAGAIQATWSGATFGGGIAMATFGTGGGPPPSGAAPVVCIMQ